MDLQQHNDLSFADRCRGAFLGLALGDAYGEPLEFIDDESVRSAPVFINDGQFRWTDDTHMSLYLANAILQTRPFNSTLFGSNVADEFLEWLHDPLTPATAPGVTCTKAVSRYEEGKDWESCGDTWSDGCGAVMRICPLAIAFEGEILSEAARISAIVTHNTAEAVYSAVATSQMLRATLESGKFDESIVRLGTRIISDRGGEGSLTVSALRTSLQLPLLDDKWLDEKAMPPGDGGWRSESALGLAVAAALRFPNHFEKAVDLAARIYGDSDSVACLTGMFLGAAGGTKVLPAEWLRVLPGRDMINLLVDKLLER